MVLMFIVKQKQMKQPPPQTRNVFMVKPKALSPDSRDVITKVILVWLLIGPQPKVLGTSQVDVSVCFHPLDPGFRVLKGLEFRSEPHISCRKAVICRSFSDFLPSKMTTSVKCGSGRLR